MANRREFLAGAAAGAVAAASPVEAISQVPHYDGVHYQAWTPDTHPHFLIVFRYEKRGAQPNVVGVSIHGGPWQFVSDAEAKQHVQAMWDAALVETKRVRQRYDAGAEESIKLHQELGVEHSPDQIRREHKVRAQMQINTYHDHVKDLMEERRMMIGRSHPRLAHAVYEKIMRERESGVMV